MSIDIEMGLRYWADGMTAERAAVDLLIDHGTWVTRSDFLDRCVLTVPEEGIAVLDWEALTSALAAGALPASSGELAVLRVVASIGARHPVDLRDVLTDLDQDSAVLVARAVLDTAGADLPEAAHALAEEAGGW